ncbi:MAG: SIR2 family protein, partial [Gammaproteobacteria bacterium]|nr:SIR2 family protein [Gammaproteobacteria bacterium]
LRYLTRGDDLGSDHVDLHIVLSQSESSCYRVEVRYHYRQRQDSGFRCWKGYVPLSAEQFQDAPIQDGQHPGLSLLKTELALRSTQHSNRSTVEACIKEAKEQSINMRVPLQLRIGISSNAGELHYIPWETLPCMDGKGIIEQDDVVFSRTALPSGDEAVECHTRAQTALRVLRVYSDVGVAAVDGGSPSRHTGIQQNMKDSLSGFSVDQSASKDLLNPDPQLFLNLLSATAGVDVLYLACEGVQRGCEYYLRMEGGDLTRSDLIRHFRQSSVPRIVILASARQLEDRTEEVESTRTLMHFAATFSQLGTAGVIICQKAMAANKWQKFLSQFSSNLNAHGHIPGAVTEARKSCLDSQDNWKPVLLTRIKSTRVWYKPGFVSDKALDSLWEMLLTSLENRSICPIIGPGIDFRLQQARVELAREMADEYDFPLSFSYRINLPAVAQYAKALEPTPQVFVGKLGKKIRHRIATITGQPLQEMESLELMAARSVTRVLEVEENNPYNILARLPINLYLTTNLDPTLEAAFELVKSGHTKRFVYGAGKTAPTFDYDVFDFTQIDLSKPDVQEASNIPLSEFTQHRPLIVQFYGGYNDLGKAVITEDDYLDFLATFGERIGDCKGSLGGTLASRDLIFLGFKWNSLEFRVLFRALQKYASGTAATRYHIAVQIDPDDDETIHPDKALEYLKQYFSGASHQQTARISLYWGSTEDFLQEFEQRYIARYQNRGHQ